MPLWNSYYIMDAKQPTPITDLLRETIIASKLPLLTLEEETGVKRQSIMKFHPRGAIAPARHRGQARRLFRAGIAADQAEEKRVGEQWGPYSRRR